MRTRLTVALLLGAAATGITGCGGDSSSSPSPTATAPSPAAPVTGDDSGGSIAGVVEDAAAAGSVVCLDLDRDLQCAASEPRTVTDASGAFTLGLPAGTTVAGQFVVAEVPGAVATAAGIPADRSRPAAPVATDARALVLAAPVEQIGAPVAIHSLSTLVVATMAADGASGGAGGNAASDVGTRIEAARTAVATAARLPATTTLVGSYAVDAGGASRAVGQVVAPALRAALQSAGDQPVAATAAAAVPAIEASLARYIDPATGRPYRTVTGRTIASETTAITAAASTCPVLPLARMRIDTANAAPIVDRENYLTATISIDATADVAAPLVATGRIRGRGNSTWLQAPKKPYRIKLDEAASVLGFPAAKDWTLLANYFDNSMVRNSHAFCLSRLTGAEYTPSSRFVEVTLNGEAIGLYLLADQVEPGANRVAIGEIDPADADPPFLVEINEKSDDEPELMFQSSLTFPYTVKSDATAAQVTAVKAKIDAFEASLATVDDPQASPRFDELMAIDTLVDYYVITEYLRNNDTFVSSTYLHRHAGGPIEFGPHWDYDLSAGNSSENNNFLTDGWWVRTVDTMYGPEQPGGYIVRLLRNPDFAAHVAGRWHFLASQQPAVFGYLDASGAALTDAQRRNLTIWPDWGDPTRYPGYVDELKGWLTARRAWLDTQIPAPN